MYLFGAVSHKLFYNLQCMFPAAIIITGHAFVRRSPFVIWQFVDTGHALVVTGHAHVAEVAEPIRSHHVAVFFNSYGPCPCCRAVSQPSLSIVTGPAYVAVLFRSRNRHFKAASQS